MTKQRQRPGPETQNSRMFEGAGIRAMEDDPRRFQVSFSSEAPYKRWWGNEILSHAPGAVDLSRLQSIGVVLYNHNRDFVLGRVECPRIEDGRGVCDIVFDEDERAEGIRQKVASGTLKGVSVGYSVRQWEEVGNGKLSGDGLYEGPCDIARQWTPLEVSIVSVPADAGVGVNRSDEENGRRNGMDDRAHRESQEQQERQEARRDAEGAQREQPPAQEPPLAPEARQAEEAGQVRRAVEEERRRTADITELCREVGMEAAAYLRDGSSVDAVREAALTHLMRSGVPVNTQVQVTRDEGDKFRAAAADALYLRYARHPDGEPPAEGAVELRGFSLLRLLERSLETDGLHPRNLSNDELVSRAFLAGDGSFAAIMDQTAGKIVRDEYEAAPTTYQRWAKTGSLSDFKSIPTYRLGEADEFKKVPPSGELPQGHFTEQPPFFRKVETYAKSIGISRQMLVNDDIGQFTRLAASNALAAARQINRAVYAALLGNPKLDLDGKPLFHADHRNLGTPGQLAMETLAELRRLMRLQTGVDKKTVLNLTPQFLLIPAALEVKALQLLHSLSDPGQANSGVVNVLRNSLEPIVDAELDVASETAYYALAHPNATDGIGIDFLNGKNSISVRRGEPMGQLGMQWDMWIDYGTYAGDYRGLTRNEGA